MLPEAPHRFFEGGALPDAYTSGEHSITFQTDFRQWLKYDYLRENYAELTSEELIFAIRHICFVQDQKITDIEFMFAAINWFYTCGNIEQTSRLKIVQAAHDMVKRQPKTGCLFWDFKSIFDSFMLQYGINLYECGKMHWWEFVGRLSGLRSDMPFPLRKQTRDLKRQDIIGGSEKEDKAERWRKWELLECERTFMGFPERW